MRASRPPRRSSALLPTETTSPRPPRLALLHFADASTLLRLVMEALLRHSHFPNGKLAPPPKLLPSSSTISTALASRVNTWAKCVHHHVLVHGHVLVHVRVRALVGAHVSVQTRWCGC